MDGKLADYVALGNTGCTFQGITFSAFDFTATASGAATAPEASAIGVQPVVGGFPDFLIDGPGSISG